MITQRLILVVLGLIFMASPVLAEHVKVYVKPTVLGSKAWGRVHIVDRKAGLQVKGKFKGLAQGKHGLVIHENANCSDGGSAMGGHYNPDNTSHGNAVKDSIKVAHSGDLGNVVADAEGNAEVNIILPGVTLKKSKHSVNRRSIAIYENGDDFSQPTGNMGKPVACGVIRVKPAVKSAVKSKV